jgi:tetratricopeptide (TPR) repeat protein
MTMFRQDSAASGVLHADAGALRYESSRENSRIPLADIALVGEYTTAQGPGAADYFLVFFTSDATRYEVPFEAKGCDAALAALGRHSNASLVPRLAASTDLASNILWPAKYVEKALFDYRPRPASSLAGRLRERLGLGIVEEHLSAAAVEVLLDRAHRELDDDPGRALALTELVLAEIDGVDDKRLRGRAWKERGTALYMAGRLKDAYEAAERARASFADAGSPSDAATAMLLTALVLNALRDSANALALLDECTRIFDQDRLPTPMLKALELRAIVLFDLHRYEEARLTLQRALVQAQQIGAESELARIENNIGRCSLEQGELDEATKYLQQAAVRFSRLGMEAECTRAWWCMAGVQKARGKKMEALAELERVEQKFAKLGMDGLAEKVREERDALKRAA